MIRRDGILLDNLRHIGHILRRKGADSCQAKESNECRTHLLQAFAQNAKTGTRPHDRQEQSQSQQGVARIGNVASGHIAIDRQHRTLFIRIVRGLKETIAFHVQDIVHKDPLLTGNTIHVYQQLALIGRGTGGSGIA